MDALIWIAAALVLSAAAVLPSIPGSTDKLPSPEPIVPQPAPWVDLAQEQGWRFVAQAPGVRSANPELQGEPNGLRFALRVQRGLPEPQDSVALLEIRVGPALAQASQLQADLCQASA